MPVAPLDVFCFNFVLSYVTVRNIPRVLASVALALYRTPSGMTASAAGHLPPAAVLGMRLHTNTRPHARPRARPRARPLMFCQAPFLVDTFR